MSKGFQHQYNPRPRHTLIPEEEYVPGLGRMAEAVYISKQDAAKRMPAARCRGCQRVTWEISIADGLMRCPTTHAKGCAVPWGRLDLLYTIPLAKRVTVLGGRLLRSMSDDEVAAAAEELGWTP